MHLGTLVSIYCGQWSLVKETSDEKVAVPLRCHSWDCPRCAPRMKRKLAQLLSGVPAHQFITLTCNPGPWVTREEAFRGMSLAVNML
ncbi:hypothetical protein LCGC14_2924900, partial [marine sediment metagenome]